MTDIKNVADPAKTDANEAEALKAKAGAPAKVDPEGIAPAQPQPKDDGEAQAKSDAEAKAKAEAEAAKKAKKPKKLNTDRLTRIAQKIDGEVRTNVPALIADLEAAEKLKISNPGGRNAYKVTMAGISSRSMNGRRVALENWSNAARRAILKAG